MDAEIVGRVAAILVGAIAAGFAAFKTAIDLSQVRRGHLRDEYRFAREFFTDAAKEEPMHPFLRAKGLQAIAGTTEIRPSEIQYLLTLKGAPEAIKNYAFGRKYLQHLPGAGNLQIEFKKGYKSPSYRKLIKAWYLTWYGAFVLAAGSPLILPLFFSKYGGTTLGPFLVTLAIFIPPAFLALRAGVKISRAEHLVKNQEAHTQAIIVPSAKRLLESV
ncbi:MAG: hypothetical protein EOP36_00405 [Rubrivivax sp.]|nr:MAG: hypothetical protein EOP36_00405 [Rubrivivax sp.]